MAFDYKVEFKEYYSAKQTAQLLFIPSFRYLCIEGSGKLAKGSPAFAAMHQVALMLRSSRRLGHDVPSWFDYVLPPVESLYSAQKPFSWKVISRLPDFFTDEDVSWAKEEAERKTGAGCSGIKTMMISEGMCAQIMHTGPASTKREAFIRIEEYAASFGYRVDESRLRHEIPLSDPERTSRNRFRTVLRLPVC